MSNTIPIACCDFGLPAGEAIEEVEEEEGAGEEDGADGAEARLIAGGNGGRRAPPGEGR